MNEPTGNRTDPVVFRQLIRAGRRAKGLSQRAAAAKLGVNFTYLSKLETGAVHFTPSDALILAMAELFDLSADMLFVTIGKCPPDLRATLAGNLSTVTRVREAIAAEP